jgi:predicted ATPase
VEQALLGDVDRLKEYAVGLEVFGRGESFDPRVDTIVRVQARRLRARLQEYYEDEGGQDAVVIDVPRGHYVAVFRSSGPSGSGTREEPLSRPPGSESVLPSLRTRLIGRERELEAVKRLLASDGVRLLTLTGAGGSGKTRLALQVLAEVADASPGGIYFVALASIADPAGVASALAQALGLRYTGGKALSEALPDHVRLAIGSRALLFLDNFEHLLSAAPLVTALVEASRSLKVLVTSREALRVYGEREYPVPPLAVPDLERPASLDELSRIPAVALFVERAAAVRPDFVLEPRTVPAVTEICARLDGLPLAIELAAARVRTLSPDAVLARLGRRLDFLTGGPRDLPARQQTLRRTIDWSHDLLGPSEQKLLRRLSAFAGGFTLEGAEAVANTRRDLGTDVLEGVASLVDKCLVVRAGRGLDDDRFSMLETTREYGLEKLAASGESEATQQAHAAYCLVLAEEGNQAFSSAEEAAWLSRCDREQDNFRAALDWLTQTRRAEWARRLGAALFRYWDGRELLVEGYERLENVRRLEADTNRSGLQALVTSYVADLLNRSRGDGEASSALFEQALGIYLEVGDRRGIACQLSALGVNSRFLGEHGAARRWFEESLEVCRELGDRAETGAALSNLAGVVSALGDHGRARALLAEARSAFGEAGDEVGVAWSVDHLGDVARDEGRLDEARQLYREAEDRFGRLGDRWGMARCRSDMAALECGQGDHRKARSLYRDALSLFREVGHNTGVASVLEGLAVSSAGAGDPRRASLLAGAAAGIRYRMGARTRPGEQARLEHTLREAWRNKDPRAAAAAWKEGWGLPLDEAVRRAAGRRTGSRATRS